MNRNSLSSVDSACNGTCPDIGSEQLVREDRLRESLRIYEHHAVEAERALLDAFAADPAAMSVHYPHLRKAHLPPLKPHPYLSAASTVEAALAQVLAPPLPPATPTPYPIWSPYHPEHVPLTFGEMLRPYERNSPESGLIGLSLALAEYYGVLAETREAELFLRRYPRALYAHGQPVPATPSEPSTPRPAESVVTLQVTPAELAEPERRTFPVDHATTLPQIGSASTATTIDTGRGPQPWKPVTPRS